VDGIVHQDGHRAASQTFVSGPVDESDSGVGAGMDTAKMPSEGP
jgi:hypothetical protein